MKASQKFSAINRIRSFSFALSGIVNLIKNEHNARLHLIAMIVVIALGFLFKIDNMEWMLIAVAIGLVFMAELLNTAVERLADYVCPGKHEKIRQIKDYAAGGVLIAAVVAVVIGFLIFVPKLFGI